MKLKRMTMALQYRPEIDGLRAIAVLPVILFHAGLGWFSGGYVGVDIFFVISGYLIGYIILQKQAEGKFSLLEFYENRARRILPALFVVILACLPMAWLWADTQQWDEFSHSLSWVSLFLSNHFFWEQSGYFADSAELKPLLHTWSLAIEEQYYLVYPLLVMMFYRWGLTRLTLLISALALASFVFCIWYGNLDIDGSFFLAPARVWELLIGALCAIIHINQAQRPTQRPGKQSLTSSQILSALGLALIVFSVFSFDSTTPFPSSWTLFPVIGAALIILYAEANTVTARLLSVRPMVAIGLISYSAYLWHQPLFAFARMRRIEDPSTLVMTALAILSLILAAITWRFIEQPFRKKNKHSSKTSGRKFTLQRNQVFAASGLGLMSLIAVGQLQASTHLMPTRLKQTQAIAKILEDIGQDRLEWIRFGSCDFFPTVNWYGKWDCKAGEGRDRDLKAVGIAIVGDSHANDKAMMLRQIGLSPYSYASSGCPLTPNTVNRYWNTDNQENIAKLTSACSDLQEFGKSEIAANDAITEIWLSNRFSKESLTAEAIANAIEYWSIPGKKLVFFSHRPEYPKMKRKLRRLAQGQVYPDIKPNLVLYNLSSKPRVKKLLQRYGAEFVDVKDLICGSDDCDYKTKDGKLLYTDGAHFSPDGARLAGGRLLEIIGCGGVSPEITAVNRARGAC